MAKELEPVEKIRRAYQLWSETRGGSAPDWLELMADDVTIRSLGGGPAGMAFSPANSGKGVAAAFLAGVVSDWEMVRYDLEEFIAQDDRVVVLSSVAFRHRETGKLAESPKVDVFRFRDGLIVDYVEFFDTAAASAATRPDGPAAA